MSAIYFNCRSGISGDMMVGSLLDLGISTKYLSTELQKLGLDGYSIHTRSVNKRSVQATRFVVTIEETQPPRYLPKICEIIDESTLPERVKNLGKEIFWRLARTEAVVHNTSVDAVHFHEIGAVDSIIDIVSAAILLSKLDIEYASCSTISLGRGQAQTAHGLIDVPSPAVRHLLKNVPTAKTNISAELTTPTGAAIIKTIAAKYTDFIPKAFDGRGYGAGTKDLEIPNVLETRVIT